MDYNINEVDDKYKMYTNERENENKDINEDDKYKIYTNERENENKDNNEDFEEQYNILFDEKVDVNALNPKINTMKSSDLNLEKELLTQSKRNITINDENDYLKSRKWDYLDDRKIKEINNKIDIIYKEMNKNQLHILETKIKQCDLSNFYNSYHPRENPTRIGALSSLNYLIETTYYSQATYVQLMFADKEQLKRYIFKYRTIYGDGECFYRGLMFSFLENIILTRNIMLLKELTIIFEEKINPNNPLVNEKEYLKSIKHMNRSLVTQTLYILIKTLEEDIKQAYIILIKVFLYAKDFDIGIIFLARYLLYEYISANENKIYSRDNKINIGCFLPEIFVTDRGEVDDFQFENFYSMQLMQPKSFAEKIVIYIAPFIFNCDINVLIYDYGTNSCIQEKHFTSEKKADYQINLLFRKAHYDVYYKQDFYNKYSEELDILNNIYEKVNYLNSNTPDEALGKSMSNININNNNNNSNNRNNDNYEAIFAQMEKNNKNSGNTPQCLECKKEFTQKENVFGLCNDCLLNILNTQIMSNYLLYLQQKGNTNNSEDKIKSFFRNINCTISVHPNIPLMTAIFNSGYKFEDLLLKIRQKICLFCGFNIQNDKYYVELPCQCRICKKECFDDYFARIIKNYDIKGNYLVDIGLHTLWCPCGYKYNLKSFVYMIEEMNKKQLKDYSEKYLELIKLNWKWKCMMCGINFMRGSRFFRLVFSDDNIKNLIKKKIDLKHLICNNCASYNRIDKAETIKCVFCKSEHKIKEYLNVDENNNTESDCIII
jgi:hypothetical protein